MKTYKSTTLCKYFTCAQAQAYSHTLNTIHRPHAHSHGLNAAHIRGLNADVCLSRGSNRSLQGICTCVSSSISAASPPFFMHACLQPLRVCHTGASSYAMYLAQDSCSHPFVRPSVHQYIPTYSGIHTYIYILIHPYIHLDLHTCLR
jgi:hypothetical protein